MSDDSVAVGIIGAGNIATRHIANLEFVGGARLVAVADTRLEAAKGMAGPRGAKAYADWREMFEKEPRLDGVLVCTPPVLREAVFQVAAERGVAVLCEKPPAGDYAEAARIARLVEDSGLLCSVGFNCRYAPSVDRCRELLDGRTVNLVRAAVLNPAALPGPSRLDEWFFLKERGGGLFDVLIHQLDLICHVAGEVAAVQAFGTNLMIPKSKTFTIEDSMSINMRFASGGTGTVVTSWACAQGVQDLTFLGEDFRLTLVAIPPKLSGRLGAVGAKATAIDETWPQGPAMGRSGKVHPDRRPEDPPDPPHCEELVVFLDAIRTGRRDRIRSPYADAARTMALLEAIDRSIATGQVETVGDAPRD